jgi:hypothetical protein
MLFITFRQKLSTRGDTDGKGVLFRHILKKIVHTLFWIVRYVDLKLQELRGSDTIKKINGQINGREAECGHSKQGREVGGDYCTLVAT